MTRELLSDDVLAKRELLRDRLSLERRELLRRVLQLHGEAFLVALVDADLGGRRPGVDGEHPVAAEQCVFRGLSPFPKTVQAEDGGLDREAHVLGRAIHGQVHAAEQEPEHHREFLCGRVARGVEVVEQIPHVEVRADDDVGAACPPGLRARPVVGRGPLRQSDAHLDLGIDLDRGVPRPTPSPLGQDAGYDLRGTAHQLRGGPLIGAAMGIRDDDAVDLGEHVLRDQVAGDRARPYRDVCERLRSHRRGHPDVPEHHDVVGEDRVRVVVGEDKHARLARHVPMPQGPHHRPEEVSRLMCSAAHDHVRVTQPDRADREVGRRRNELARLRRRRSLSSLAAALQIVVRELVQERLLSFEVQKSAFRKCELDSVGIHVSEVACSHLADRFLTREEHGPDEARQVTRPFEHPRVERLDEDDGRPVARDRQDLPVQRRLDVEHSNLPFRPGSTGADCSASRF